MSRYHIIPRQPGLTCVVGWDPPLGTFFAQVRTHPGAGIPPREVLWVGTDIAELGTLEALMQTLAPYATLPEDVRRSLEADQHTTGFRPNLGTALVPQLQRMAARKGGPR